MLLFGRVELCDVSLCGLFTDRCLPFRGRGPVQFLVSFLNDWGRFGGMITQGFVPIRSGYELGIQNVDEEASQGVRSPLCPFSGGGNEGYDVLRVRECTCEQKIELVFGE